MQGQVSWACPCSPFWLSGKEHEIRRYIVHRLFLSILSLLGATFIAFTIMRLAPGDPVLMMAGEFNVSEQARQNIKKRYGLDKPFLVQYLIFVRNATHGDLGTSYHFIGTPVTEILAKGIPVSLRFQSLTMAVAIMIAIPLGIIAALKHNTWIDTATMFFAVGGISLPSFAVATFLIVGLAVKLGWFPAAGLDTPIHYVLPTIALATRPCALLARMLRASMLEVIRQDYIATARSKGLSEVVVVIRHALKNAILPVLTIIGIMVGRILSGSFLVETIFNIPGLGRIGVTAVLQRDYPVVVGTSLLLCSFFLLVTFIVDVLYAYVDPRIKAT